MEKDRKIINTNIRLDLQEEADRKAWEHLQNLDRKKYKSYTRAVVIALNDYFDRENKLASDPYLETREKEDEFLRRIEEAVERGAKNFMPYVLVGEVLPLLKPALEQFIGQQEIRNGISDGAKPNIELSKSDEESEE